MIEIKVKILSVGNTDGGFITEGAAKSIVEHFEKKPEKMFIRIDKSPIIIGEVLKLEYDEVEKVVSAISKLGIDFTTGGRILQSLETPQGKRVIDCELLKVNAVLNPLPTNEGEVKK